MVISIKWIIISIGFCVVIIVSSCGEKGLGCANTTYSFQISENVNPDKDSIRIRDTIFLNLSTVTKLSDLNSGNIIDYGNAKNLGNVVALLTFLPENKSRGAINDFDLIMIKGTKINSIDPATNQEVLFTEESGFYKFKMAIVAKAVGRYVLTVGNAANVYRNNDKCTKANFNINFQSTNQHFYLLNSWRPDLILDDTGKKKVYYFKVY